MQNLVRYLIDNGLSRGASMFLAIFAALFGAMMFLSAPPTENAYDFYLFGTFCLLVSVACLFKGRPRQFICSLMGVGIFIASLWFVYDQISSNGALFSSRTSPSVFNSILFFVFAGLPGITYAVKNKFGIW